MGLYAKSRIRLEPGQIVVKLRRPFYHGGPDQVVEARGMVMWIDLDANMVFVLWATTKQDAVVHATLSTTDFDEWKTEYGVVLHENHERSIHPAWVTEEGLSDRNNRIFRFLH